MPKNVANLLFWLPRLLTASVAGLYLWALLIITLPCIPSWMRDVALAVVIFLCLCATVRYKFLHKRWFAWLVVFCGLNFTIGSYVAGKTFECACAVSKDSCSE